MLPEWASGHAQASNLLLLVYEVVVIERVDLQAVLSDHMKLVGVVPRPRENSPIGGFAFQYDLLAGTCVHNDGVVEFNNDAERLLQSRRISR